MTRDNGKFSQLLSKIVKKLDDFVEREHERDTSETDDAEPASCVVKTLPDAIQVPAARTAILHNPRNATTEAALEILESNKPHVEKLRLAVRVDKYWGKEPRTLTVSFMESSSDQFRTKILSHLNAWHKSIGIKFAYTQQTGMVRITTSGHGYASWTGTEIRHIALNQPTMWLGQFHLNTPDSEYRRVVRHEAGHTLGFPHEHMRKEFVSKLIPRQVYAYCATHFGWNQQQVNEQVLTPLNSMSIVATEPDDASIMSYHFPSYCTTDGKGIRGGADINELDYWFAGKIYPKVGAASSRSLFATSQGMVHMSPQSAVSAAGLQAEPTEAEDLTGFTETPLSLE